MATRIYDYSAADLLEAKQNGIQAETFRARLRSGWSKEFAKTYKKERLHKDDIRMAQEQGISKRTAQKRMSEGWTKLQAITIPTGKLGKQAQLLLNWKPGHNCPTCDSRKIRYAGEFGEWVNGFFCGESLAEWDFHRDRVQAMYVDWSRY